MWVFYFLFFFPLSNYIKLLIWSNAFNWIAAFKIWSVVCCNFAWFLSRVCYFIQWISPNSDYHMMFSYATCDVTIVRKFHIIVCLQTYQGDNSQQCAVKIDGGGGVYRLCKIFRNWKWWNHLWCWNWRNRSMSSWSVISAWNCTNMQTISVNTLTRFQSVEGSDIDQFLLDQENRNTL